MCDENRWRGGTNYVDGFPHNLRGHEVVLAIEESEVALSINFESAIPFTGILEFIETGLNALRKTFAKGNQKILAHFERARDCLQDASGGPLCDVLSIIVLTLASSTKTPTLPESKGNFEPGPHKESGTLDPRSCNSDAAVSLPRTAFVVSRRHVMT